MASFQNYGCTIRHDQQMALGARVNICQRTVGENTLPGYGPVILVKRPVRIRMQGVVGAGGLKPPATRFKLNFE